MNSPKFILVVILIFIVWTLVFSGFTASHTKEGVKKEIKWEGILWVCLDHYTIWKYKSDDEPIKLITKTTTYVEN